MQTINAKLSSLSEDGQMPQQGDEVDLVVKGTIDKVDGENAVIRVVSVNDEPDASPDQPTDPNSDPMGDQLQQQASDMDSQTY